MKLLTFLKWIIPFILLTIISCTDDKPPPITEAEARSEILKLHEAQRKFHFDKMVEEFVDLLSPNHISVNRGKIERMSKEEHTDRFKNYFDAVEFIKWDDVSPPVIKFSDDFSMAYTIVDKAVIIEYEDENGELIKESTDFSWVAIYKKYDTGWKIDCVASTNKPAVKL